MVSGRTTRTNQPPLAHLSLSVFLSWVSWCFGNSCLWLFQLLSQDNKLAEEMTVRNKTKQSPNTGDPFSAAPTCRASRVFHALQPQNLTKSKCGHWKEQDAFCMKSQRTWSHTSSTLKSIWMLLLIKGRSLAEPLEEVI